MEHLFYFDVWNILFAKMKYAYAKEWNEISPDMSMQKGGMRGTKICICRKVKETILVPKLHPTSDFHIYKKVKKEVYQFWFSLMQVCCVCSYV